MLPPVSGLWAQRAGAAQSAPLLSSLQHLVGPNPSWLLAASGALWAFSKARKWQKGCCCCARLGRVPPQSRMENYSQFVLRLLRPIILQSRQSYSQPSSPTCPPLIFLDPPLCLTIQPFLIFLAHVPSVRPKIVALEANL